MLREMHYADVGVLFCRDWVMTFIKVDGRWMQPVENRGNGNCLIESVLAALHQCIDNFSIKMMRWNLYSRAYKETFGIDGVAVGSSQLGGDQHFGALATGDFQGVPHRRYLLHLRHELEGLPQATRLLDHVRMSLESIWDGELSYYLLDLVEGRYRIVKRNPRDADSALIGGDDHEVFGLGAEAMATHFILYDPPRGNGAHGDAGGHFRLLRICEEGPTEMERRRPRVYEELRVDFPRGVVMDITRMEFNVVRPGSRCTCDSDPTSCSVTQHFVQRPRDELGNSGIFFILGDVQLTKTRHSLAHACVEYYVKGLFPIVFTRVATCDVKRWVDACDAFNESIKQLASNVDGSVKLVTFQAHEVQHFVRHIEGGTRGIPILILMYNITGLKACQKAIEETCRLDGITCVESSSPFHVICDESDLATRGVKADTVAERQLIHKEIRLFPVKRKSYYGGGSDVDDDEQDDDADELETGTIFKNIHSFTFVTATPLANLINKLQEWRDGPFSARKISVVPEYYCFEEQVHDTPVDRRIVLREAMNKGELLGDMLHANRVRRAMFTSNQVKYTGAQLEFARQAAQAYNSETKNANNKIIFTGAWYSRVVTCYIGGHDVVAVGRYRECLSSYMRVSDTIKWSSDPSCFVIKGDVVDFYNAVLTVHALYRHGDCVTSDIDSVVRRYRDEQGDRIENDGPDTMIATGNMGQRGVTFKTSFHEWELTDQHMEGDRWSVESIIQALRICGVSRHTVLKQFWATKQFLKTVASCLTINAKVCNDLMDGLDATSILERAFAVAQEKIQNGDIQNGELVEGVDAHVVERFLLNKRRGIHGRKMDPSRQSASREWNSKAHPIRIELDDSMKAKRLRDSDILYIAGKDAPPAEGVAIVPSGEDGCRGRAAKFDIFEMTLQRDETRTTFIGALDQICGGVKDAATTAEVSNLLKGLFDGNLNKTKEFVRYAKANHHLVDWFGPYDGSDAEVYFTKGHMFGVRSLIQAYPDLQPDSKERRVMKALDSLHIYVGVNLELQHIRGTLPDCFARGNQSVMNQLCKKGYLGRLSERGLYRRFR